MTPQVVAITAMGVSLLFLCIFEAILLVDLARDIFHGR
jgi:hypothetical protein